MPLSVFALGTAGGRGAALARSHQRAASTACRSIASRRRSSSRGVLPALWYLHPRFLRTSRARVCILVLVAWRIASALLFVQDGWCVRFQPARPFAKDAGRVPHAWDMRADWRAFGAGVLRDHDAARTGSSPSFPRGSSTCRRTARAGRFPADRPPGATVALSVHGFLSARDAGVLQIDTGPDVAATISVDGVAIRGPSPVARWRAFRGDGRRADRRPVGARPRIGTARTCGHA